MGRSRRNLPHSVRDAARNWLVIMIADEPDTETKARFEDWIRCDPSHAQAYAEARRLWQEVELVETAAFAVPQSSARPRPQAIFAMMSTALTIGVIFAVLMFSPPVHEGNLSAQQVRVATAIGETRQFRLADGTSVILGAASSLQYSEGSRGAEVLEGAAFFDVVPDPDSQFRIKAPGVEVRVLGTRFDVRARERATQVSVSHGVVELRVGGSAGLSDVLVLTEGQASVAHLDGTFGPVTQFDPEAPDWRTGWLSYDNATLGDVIADINRYRSQPIRVESPEIAARPITVAFRIDQVDQLLGGLEATQPVRFVNEGETLVMKPVIPKVPE